MSSKLNYEKLKKQDLIKTRGADPYRSDTNKLMKSKYESQCIVCKKKVSVGDWINYYFESKFVKHQHCKLNTWSTQPAASSPRSFPSSKTKNSVSERRSEATKRTRAKRGIK